jgi:hypothetical protein
MILVLLDFARAPQMMRRCEEPWAASCVGNMDVRRQSLSSDVPEVLRSNAAAGDKQAWVLASHGTQ